MRGRSLTETEVQEVRAALVRVALELVVREGREACSLRRVAAEAGISRMTPYSYFEDKDALLDAVRVAALDLLADACEAAMAKGCTVPDRLAAVGRAYVNFAIERWALYALIFEAHGGGPEHERAVARYRDLAEAPLREAHALGLVALPPQRLAMVLWAATHGLVGLRQSGKLPEGVRFDQLWQDLGDTLAFGFVPREVVP